MGIGGSIIISIVVTLLLVYACSGPWPFGHHEDRSPTHGYAVIREDAMAAFAKSWRRVWHPPAALIPGCADRWHLLAGRPTAATLGPCL